MRANIEEHLHLARLAAAEGARVVVFPELSLTGYELGMAKDLAFSADDARLAPLVREAVSASAVIVVGAPVHVGTRLHIGAFILRTDGSIGLYTKRHLGAFAPTAVADGVVPPPEATVFAPGDCDPLIDVDGARAAVAICADIGRPSHAKRASERGASAYLASMFVIPSEFSGDAEMLRGRAAEHAMVVALANYGAPTGGLAAAGRSSLWSESGALLVQLGARGPGVAVARRTAAGWWAKAVRPPGE